VPVVRKAEIKSLDMPTTSTDASGTAVAAAPPPPATTVSKAATREVSYATEKPADKSGSSSSTGTSSTAAKTSGKDC